MADSVDPDDVDDFVTNVSWADRYTYYSVLKSSPGTSVFGCDMLFDISYLADWHKIRIHMQKITDHNTAHKNACRGITIMWLADKY